MMRTGSMIWGLSSLLHRRINPGSTARCKTRCRSNSGRYERLVEQSWWLLDSSVCHALRLRIRTSKTFWTSWSIWDVPGVEVQANARVERYEVSNKFYSCKMKENSCVSEHILRMSGYHNDLTQLGVNLPDDSVIDKVLQSLPPSYKGFMMNYNMQGWRRLFPSSLQWSKLRR